jgi:CheY-like chemotaxis protein
MTRTSDVQVRILVVDDNAVDGEALCALLREDGYDVAVVPSSEAALARFEHETYTIVLADLQLPGDSGIELVRRLRTEAPATAVVVMTGHASVSTAVSALKHGAWPSSLPIAPRICRTSCWPRRRPAKKSSKA